MFDALHSSAVTYNLFSLTRNPDVNDPKLRGSIVYNEEQIIIYLLVTDSIIADIPNITLKLLHSTAKKELKPFKDLILKIEQFWCNLDDIRESVKTLRPDEIGYQYQQILSNLSMKSPDPVKHLAQFVCILETIDSDLLKLMRSQYYDWWITFSSTIEILPQNDYYTSIQFDPATFEFNLLQVNQSQDT